MATFLFIYLVYICIPFIFNSVYGVCNLNLYHQGKYN